MSVQQWEAYYRGGALATCPTARDGGYDLEVRDAWVEFFSMLPKQARVLDVGTGNGVVALIAAETARSNGSDWEIHGTDLARIDPLRHVPDGAQRLAGIHFHPGIPTERMPFEDASFDAVSGHYALEYTDTAAALAEIHRVLKPGADAQFIMHASDSVLLRSAHVSLQEADYVLKQTRIFRRLHRLVTMEQVAPEATRRATDELREAIQALRQALPEARRRGGGRVMSVALDAVQKLLEARKTLRADATGLEVDRAEEDMRASVRRLNDLVEHARDEQGMALVEQQAAAAGFIAIERTQQHHSGGNLVGWRLEMRRA